MTAKLYFLLFLFASFLDLRAHKIHCKNDSFCQKIMGNPSNRCKKDDYSSAVNCLTSKDHYVGLNNLGGSFISPLSVGGYYKECDSTDDAVVKLNDGKPLCFDDAKKSCVCTRNRDSND
jgi:hypothetical protein